MRFSQESLNQPMSGTDFCTYDVPPKTRSVKTISGSQDTLKVTTVGDDGQESNLIVPENERKLLHQMSSGFFGTQQSKDDPNSTISNPDIELKTLNAAIDSDRDKLQYEFYQNSSLNRSTSCRKSLDEPNNNDNTNSNINNSTNYKSVLKAPSSSSLQQHHLIDPLSFRQISSDPSKYCVDQTNRSLLLENYSGPVDLNNKRQTSNVDIAMLQQQQQQMSSPSQKIMKHNKYRTSVSSPPSANFYYHPRNGGGGDTNSNSSSCNYSEISRQLKRLSSNQSINTLSLDQEELLNHVNLKDELLNCEQKELFQFLNEDFDNYFSETVGLGSASMIDPDTNSLITPTNIKNENLISAYTDRKTSNGSLRSNISSISNSIFQVLESRRGGSLSGSTDKVYPVANTSIPVTRSNVLLRAENETDEKEPLVNRSEFDEIIHDFETELKSLKSLSFERKSMDMPDEDGGGPSTRKANTLDTVIYRRKPERSSEDENSNALKRRSLEKQKNIIDDEFNASRDFKKLQMPPFGDALELRTSPVMRRKNEFHNSFDRIKRYSLIERVEELNEDEKPLKVESEKLPRKQLSKDKLETISLKSLKTEEPIQKTVTLPKKESVDLQKTFSHDPNNLSQLLKKTVQIQEKSSSKETTPSKKSKKKNKSQVAEMAERPWHCLVSYVDDLTVGGRRNSQGGYDDPMSFPSFGNSKPPKTPQDCFPKKCYERCSCWDDVYKTKYFQKWTQIRTAVLMIVDTPVFEWFVLVLIFASSVTLCFEDIYLGEFS